MPQAVELGAMAVTLNMLTDGFAKSAGPGDCGDGSGPYLQVKPSVAKSWMSRYKLRRKTAPLRLGPLHAISLREARP